MKRKYWFQRTAAMVLCLLLCLCSMRTAASASEAYPYPSITDRDALCSLSLAFGAPGVTVRVYRVAEVSEDVRFTLTGAFAGYPVNLDGLTSAGWAALAQTLRGYAFLDDIQPLATGVSDENGYLTFTDLPIGLYLVEGERTGNVEEGYRQPAPFVICLPNWESATDPDTGTVSAGWQYNVAARPKYTTLDGDVDMRRVLKVWEDGGGSAANRPAQISVTLLKNGEPYDTVDLNAENNWRYAWEELDGEADWQLVENVSAGSYTVSVSLQGVTYVVTNTYSPPPPDNPPPDNPPPDNPPPDNPPPDNPPPENPPPDNPPPVPPSPDEDIDEPEVPLSTTDPEPDPRNPEDPNHPEEEDIDDPDIPLARLPQTGQLWWPVPLLAVGGMTMLLLGLIFRRRSRSDEG